MSKEKKNLCRKLLQKHFSENWGRPTFTFCYFWLDVIVENGNGAAGKIEIEIR